MLSRKMAALGVALLTILSASPVSAAQFMAPSNDSGTVVIGEGTYEDVYAVGGTVSVNSNIQGDLFAAGGTLNVSRNVGQDLFAAGGNLSIFGEVGGDARITGGNITINGPIAEDAMVGGGTIIFDRSARVGRDLWVGGGSITLQAPVHGDVNIGGGEVYINSEIGGNVHVESENLTFGPLSKVVGKVTYRGPKEPVMEQGAAVSNVDFQKTEKRVEHDSGSRAGIIGIGFLIGLLALLAAALLLNTFFHKTVQTVTTTAYRSPWMSLGVGMLAVFVIPVMLIISLVTVVGYYVALILLAWFVFMLLISCVLGALFLGGLVFKLVRKGEWRITWQAALVGAVLFSILNLIPLLGWLAALVLSHMALGAALLVMKDQMKAQRAKSK